MRVSFDVTATIHAVTSCLQSPRGLKTPIFEQQHFSRCFVMSTYTGRQDRQSIADNMLVMAMGKRRGHLCWPTTLKNRPGSCQISFLFEVPAHMR